MPIASAPFQYDPTASGINDIPYVSGIESGMAWLDSIVSRHDLSGPLVNSSGFEWYKYYSEDNREKITPQLAPPFALEGMPMNVSGFWGQFKEKIAFIGRETGTDKDNAPWTNWAANPYWSGHYRDPVYDWAESGLNDKPLPQGMFEYGQIDKRDFNTYIKRYTGGGVSFSHQHSVRRRIIGAGHVQSQEAISQTPIMTSESEFEVSVSMSSGTSDELIETKDRHIIRVWDVTEDCNQTYEDVKSVAAADAVGSGVAWLDVDYYFNEAGGFNSSPYVNTNWIWQIGVGSGYDLGGIKTHRVLGDVHEDYYARNFTGINDLGSTYQMGKTVNFTNAPTSVTYSLAKKLALNGSGYQIYSNFVPGASSLDPCSSNVAIGEYNWGYSMGNISLGSNQSKELLYGTSGYNVFHTEGAITNGTPAFVTNGVMDPVFLDPDDTSDYVYLTRTIDDLEPQTAHPQKAASWWSYFVERFSEVSGIEVPGRELVNISHAYSLGYNARTPTSVQTISGCSNTVATDIWVPTSLGLGGTNTGYFMSGALIRRQDYAGSAAAQSSFRSQKTPPSGVFTIGGPGSFLGVDPPIDIFGTSPNTGPYFGL